MTVVRWVCTGVVVLAFLAVVAAAAGLAMVVVAALAGLVWVVAT